MGNQSINEGEILKNYFKGSGKLMQDIAKALEMTRQNMRYHLQKETLDAEFLQKVKEKLDIDFAKVKEQYIVEPSPNQEKQTLNKTENDDSRLLLEDETDISSPSPTKKTTGADIRRKKAIGSGTDDEEGLVYVPIAAQAGYSRNFTDPVFINQLERIYVPGLPYKGDNFRYFEVEGDSMHPTIQEGMQVIAQRVDLSNWDGRIKNFYIHVIVTDSQILIKRLAKKDQKQSHFAMISDNDLYPQEPIRVEDIKELWYVKRILDWRMAPPKHFEILV